MAEAEKKAIILPTPRVRSSVKNIIEYGNADTLAQDFGKLVANEFLSDIKLVIGEEKVNIPAHKIIMCQRSPYFAKVFLSGMKESVTGIYEATHFAPSVFMSVLQYIYTGKVHLSNDNALHVLSIADELNIVELKKYCVTHVRENIDIDSALQLLDLAYRYFSEELVQACYDFIKHHTAEVINTESFMNISKDTLMRFLDSEYLAVDEIEIYAALIRWGLKRVAEASTADNEEVSANRDSYMHYKNVLSGVSYQAASVEYDSNDEDPEKTPLPANNSLVNSPASSSAISVAAAAADKQKVKASSSGAKRRNNSGNAFDSVNNDTITAKLALEGTWDMRILGLRIAEQDKLQLRTIVQDLIPFIRFPLMTSQHLVEIVEPFENVPDWLLLEAYRYLVSPDKVLNPKRAQKRRGLSEHLSQEFEGSTILTEQHKRILSSWCEFMSKKKKKWMLQYKATRDGFDSKIFHDLCDSKGASITVCRTIDGYVFGGVNTQSWTNNNSWNNASDTFIFSLINPFNDGARKLKVKNPARAVYNSNSFGPTFGGGGQVMIDPFDLYIDSTMRKGHTNVGNAYSTYRGGWRSDEAQRSLAGSLNNWSLNEIEVFMLS